jgi:hypothetical protein
VTVLGSLCTTAVVQHQQVGCKEVSQAARNGVTKSDLRPRSTFRSVAFLEHQIGDLLSAYSSGHELPVVPQSVQELLLQRLNGCFGVLDADPVLEEDIPEVVRQFSYGHNVPFFTRVPLGCYAFVEPLRLFLDGPEITEMDISIPAGGIFLVAHSNSFTHRSC